MLQSVGVLDNTTIRKNVVFVKKGKNLKKVFVNDIIYIEVENRYCNFITTTEKFLIQISLNKLLPYLEGYGFVRTHRNFVANLHRIQEITLSENSIKMQGDYHITLSDKYKVFLENYHIF